MSVITISGQFGSGGDEIAADICETLWYRIFDKHMIIEAAKAEGISAIEIGDISEESFQGGGFFTQLFSRPQAALSARVWKESTDGMRTIEDYILDEKEVFSLTQRAIKAAHKIGNMVIVGRGGQVVLQGEPDTLHVRIVAPLEQRIQHVKQHLKVKENSYQADIEMRRKAQDIILARDAASEQYLKHYYHVDWDSPLLYDLVINTATLGFKKAAEIIMGMATSNKPSA